MIEPMIEETATRSPAAKALQMRPAELVADSNVIPYLLQRSTSGAATRELAGPSPSRDIDSVLLRELQRVRDILAESQVELDRDAKHVLYSRRRELYRR
jgi:hypothetical protein